MQQLNRNTKNIMLWLWKAHRPAIAVLQCMSCRCACPVPVHAMSLRTSCMAHVKLLCKLFYALQAALTVCRSSTGMDLTSVKYTQPRPTAPGPAILIRRARVSSSACSCDWIVAGDEQALKDITANSAVWANGAV